MKPACVPAPAQDTAPIACEYRAPFPLLTAEDAMDRNRLPKSLGYIMGGRR